MRWTKKDLLSSEPKIGSKRIQSDYLIVPKVINGETRWLESATWEEKFETHYLFDEWNDKIEYTKWVPVRWIDRISTE